MRSDELETIIFFFSLLPFFYFLSGTRMKLTRALRYIAVECDSRVHMAHYTLCVGCCVSEKKVKVMGLKHCPNGKRELLGKCALMFTVTSLLIILSFSMQSIDLRHSTFPCGLLSLGVVYVYEYMRSSFPIHYGKYSYGLPMYTIITSHDIISTIKK